jgi:hypothetical protein
MFGGGSTTDPRRAYLRTLGINNTSSPNSSQISSQTAQGEKGVPGLGEPLSSAPGAEPARDGEGGKRLDKRRLSGGIQRQSSSSEQLPSLLVQTDDQIKAHRRRLGEFLRGLRSGGGSSLSVARKDGTNALVDGGNSSGLSLSKEYLFQDLLVQPSSSPVAGRVVQTKRNDDVFSSNGGSDGDDDDDDDDDSGSESGSTSDGGIGFRGAAREQLIGSGERATADGSEAAVDGSSPPRPLLAPSFGRRPVEVNALLRGWRSDRSVANNQQTRRRRQTIGPGDTLHLDEPVEISALRRACVASRGGLLWAVSAPVPAPSAASVAVAAQTTATGFDTQSTSPGGDVDTPGSQPGMRVVVWPLMLRVIPVALFSRDGSVSSVVEQPDGAAGSSSSGSSSSLSSAEWRAAATTPPASPRNVVSSKVAPQSGTSPREVLLRCRQNEVEDIARAAGTFFPMDTPGDVAVCPLLRGAQLAGSKSGDVIAVRLSVPDAIDRLVQLSALSGATAESDTNPRASAVRTFQRLLITLRHTSIGTSSPFVGRCCSDSSVDMEDRTVAEEDVAMTLGRVARAFAIEFGFPAVEALPIVSTFPAPGTVASLPSDDASVLATGSMTLAFHCMERFLDTAAKGSGREPHLDVIAATVTSEDSLLAQHLSQCGVSVQELCRPVLASLFTSILPPSIDGTAAHDLLVRIWDAVVCVSPDVLPFAAFALLNCKTALRKGLLKCDDAESMRSHLSTFSAHVTRENVDVVVARMMEVFCSRSHHRLKPRGARSAKLR